VGVVLFGGYACPEWARPVAVIVVVFLTIFPEPAAVWEKWYLITGYVSAQTARGGTTKNLTEWRTEYHF